MGVSQNPNTYSDVEQVFQAARAAGGAKYELPSRGDAVYWRTRAYTYRKLLGKLSASPLTPDIPGPTKWDDVKLTLEDKSVVIRFQGLTGKLHALDNDKPINVPEVQKKLIPLDADDPLLEAAQSLLGEIDDED